MLFSHNKSDVRAATKYQEGKCLAFNMHWTKLKLINGEVYYIMLLLSYETAERSFLNTVEYLKRFSRFQREKANILYSILKSKKWFIVMNDDICADVF